ncbi:bestrophin family ion channel [Aureibaculum sp. 2210JD6-5]|uniref:bestrophin family protein n=1 Tax=Aureibaculum sp. 2210JD6-5 TaxID=3103957 RepID=UPI002AAC5894|nr:bestrophin family ion channel [Aureibaculum sp. 2210JD6-5]MDY7395579.1 bestrophin family ion channel [Aureibaculum sp. 2210JD6-5]
MYTKKVFPAKEMIKWTKFESFLFLVIGTIFVILIKYLGLTWLKIPWAPIAVIGSAVAFVIGFQNNSAYGRIWEARKIWGGIVNTSRTFGVYVQDMVTNEHSVVKHTEEELQHEIKTLTYRHIAWMTALRHAMRQPKPWETANTDKGNKKWTDMIGAPEKRSTLQDDLKPYLSAGDLAYTLSKNNKQTALLYLQSHHLKKLKEQGVVWEFSFLELESLVQEQFTLQGQSERIKNFPYPRQFATLNHYFMWIFVMLLPLGIVPQFAEIGNDIATNFPIMSKYFIWFSIPVYVLVAWVFHTMERIGRTGESPFEGLVNDVPISTIARGIEIDLRQNLGESEEEIPEQFPVIYDTQM